MNTVGSANTISAPATPPIGGATTIANPQNTVGGTAQSGGIAASPGVTATTPAGTANLTTLPNGVQSVLQPFSLNGSLGTISQQNTANGVVYTATVTQNGMPVQLQIAPNGRIISRTLGTTPAVAGISGTTAGIGTLGTAQAGLPFSTLPGAVQQGVLSQLGNAGQIQTISQDISPNGNTFRVTAMQNGVPTEFRFASNGTLLGTTPLNGTATSAFVPGVVVPGSGVLFDSLPTAVQSAIRSQLGNARISGIMQQQGTNGMSYFVSYDQNGRPMRMVVGPDGRIISNTPLSAVGNAAISTSGTSSSTNNVSTNRTTSLNLDDLPAAVRQTLKTEAPDAEIRFINREQRSDGDVYLVGTRTNDHFVQLQIDAHGKLIRDSRDTPVVAVGQPKDLIDHRADMPFSTLPIAVQNAIKAYATASDVRTVNLSQEKGKTVYDVVFYTDGRRDRMIVGKDGNMIRVERDVPPAAELGAKDRNPTIAIGDLPPKVQDTIRKQTDNALVKEINTKQVGDQSVYAVKYEKDGPVELLVSTDGTVVLPEGAATSSDSRLVAAPSPTKEADPVRIVDATSSTPTATSSQGIGTSAPAERGIKASEDNTASAPSSATERRESNPSVPLSDVPVPVQNTAKKLAGTATIESISPKLQDSAVAYEVVFNQNGTKKTVVLNKDGVEMQSKAKTSAP
jgi:uncharacterized membrane protein YkoI